MLKYKIINKDIFVRKTPNPDSDIVNILKPETVVEVLEISNGWYKLSNRFFIFPQNNIKLITDTNEFVNTLNYSADTFKDTIPQPIDYSQIVNSTPSNDAISNQSGNSSQTPTLNSQSTPNNNQGYNRSANNSLGTNPTVSATDTSSLNSTRMSIDEINRRFTGPNSEFIGNMGYGCFQLNPDGSIVVEGGSPKRQQMPITLLGKDNGSTVLSINDQGYATVRDINGDVYVVDATQGQVSPDPNSDDYYSIPVTEEMLAKREATSLKSTIERIMNGNFEDLFGSIKRINSINIKDIQGIFGYPYQFLPVADPRVLTKSNKDIYFSNINFDINRAENQNDFITSNDLAKSDAIVDQLLEKQYVGRHFARKIAGRAPIMTIQAGIPVFLKGYSQDAKDTILATLAGFATDMLTDISLDEVLSSSGQYYSFQESPDEYFEAVNAVCRAMAIFLGIEDLRADIVVPHNSSVSNSTLDTLDWQDCTQHAYFGYFKGAVCFYINAEPQVHEQFTNATRQSQLASSVNQISDQAMEIQFILGGLGAAAGKSFDWPKDGITNVNESLTDATRARTGTGLIDSMLKNIRTFLSGGKMIFPEIWSDSSFGRTYNVTIKLVSPDCDVLSIYLNILVPLAHILGFVLPRSVGDNSYISPFLVRCWFQSQFNIELGIVSSCEIIKGDSGSWTQDGLPTQVIVQLSIKDLYSVMSYSLNTSASNILTNPAQLNYIANLCGMNIGPTNLSRTMAIWMMLAKNRFTDGVVNIPRQITRWMFDNPFQTASGLFTWFSGENY